MSAGSQVRCGTFGKHPSSTGKRCCCACADEEATKHTVSYSCARHSQTLPAWHWQSLRGFAADAARLVTVPLSQTGEGIKECELIEWHIKARTAHSAAVLTRGSC